MTPRVSFYPPSLKSKVALPRLPQAGDPSARADRASALGPGASVTHSPSDLERAAFPLWASVSPTAPALPPPWDSLPPSRLDRRLSQHAPCSGPDLLPSSAQVAVMAVSLREATEEEKNVSPTAIRDYRDQKAKVGVTPVTIDLTERRDGLIPTEAKLPSWARRRSETL